MKKIDDNFIIIDEAHSISGTKFYDQLFSMLKTSKNVKLILLSATPIKNKADDIIDLINILRIV